MSAISNVLGFLGSVAAVAYPPAVPFLAFAARVEPTIELALPLLRDAIAGGPAAFAAFKTKAPDFYGHLRGLAVSLKVDGPAGSPPPTDHEVAALGAHIAGIDPPGWVRRATVLWWDRDKASFT